MRAQCTRLTAPRKTLTSCCSDITPSTVPQCVAVLIHQPTSSSADEAARTTTLRRSGTPARAAAATEMGRPGPLPWPRGAAPEYISFSAAAQGRRTKDRLPFSRLRTVCTFEHLALLKYFTARPRAHLLRGGRGDAAMRTSTSKQAAGGESNAKGRRSQQFSRRLAA